MSSKRFPGYIVYECRKIGGKPTIIELGFVCWAADAPTPAWEVDMLVFRDNAKTPEELAPMTNAVLAGLYAGDDWDTYTVGAEHERISWFQQEGYEKVKENTFCLGKHCFRRSEIF